MNLRVLHLLKKKGAASDYNISNQLTDFLDLGITLRLSVRPTYLDRRFGVKICKQNTASRTPRDSHAITVVEKSLSGPLGAASSVSCNESAASLLLPNSSLIPGVTVYVEVKFTKNTTTDLCGLFIRDLTWAPHRFVELNYEITEFDRVQNRYVGNYKSSVLTNEACEKWL